MLRSRVSLVSFSVCLALAASGAAHAQVPESYARTGPYLGLAGSLGIYTGLENSLPGNADVDEPVGMNGRIGYRLHSLFAVEAAAEWLPEADVDVFGSDIGTVESWTATLNGKAYPLSGRFQPFGLVGLGAMIAEGDGAGLSNKEYGFAARFGGGVDIYLTAKLMAAFEISYVLPTGDLNDLDFVSLGWGLGYRF